MNTRSKRQSILRYKSIRKIGFRLFDHDFHGRDGTVRSQAFAFSLTISENNVTQTLCKNTCVQQNVKFHPKDCDAAACNMNGQN